MVSIYTCFEDLQGKQTLLEDRNVTLQKFCDGIESQICLPSDPSLVDLLTEVMENDILLQYKSISVYQSKIAAFLEGLGSLCVVL